MIIELVFSIALVTNPSALVVQRVPAATYAVMPRVFQTPEEEILFQLDPVETQRGIDFIDKLLEDSAKDSEPTN